MIEPSELTKYGYLKAPQSEFEDMVYEVYEKENKGLKVTVIVDHSPEEQDIYKFTIEGKEKVYVTLPAIKMRDFITKNKKHLF